MANQAPSTLAGAAKRASWPVRRYRLGAEPSDDLSATTTPQARLAMMWSLALEAWAWSDRAVPAYARHEAPVTRRPLRASAEP